MAALDAKAEILHNELFKNNQPVAPFEPSKTIPSHDISTFQSCIDLLFNEFDLTAPDIITDLIQRYSKHLNTDVLYTFRPMSATEQYRINLQNPGTYCFQIHVNTEKCAHGSIGLVFNSKRFDKVRRVNRHQQRIQYCFQGEVELEIYNCISRRFHFDPDQYALYTGERITTDSIIFANISVGMNKLESFSLYVNGKCFDFTDLILLNEKHSVENIRLVCKMGYHLTFHERVRFQESQVQGPHVYEGANFKVKEYSIRGIRNN